MARAKNSKTKQPEVKLYKVSYKLGNTERVVADADSPMTYKDAIASFRSISQNGWRVWLCEVDPEDPETSLLLDTGLMTDAEKLEFGLQVDIDRFNIDLDKVRAFSDRLQEFLHTEQSFKWLEDNNNLDSNFKITENALLCVCPLADDRAQLRSILVLLSKQF